MHWRLDRHILIISSLLAVFVFCCVCTTTKEGSSSKPQSSQTKLTSFTALPRPVLSQDTAPVSYGPAVPVSTPQPALAKTEQITLASARVETGKPAVDAQQRHEVLKSRIVAHPGPLPCVTLRYDQHTPRLDLARVPGGKALDMAAKWYAISTLDFSVTPRKLIDAGFWPYTCVKEEDLDKFIYDTNIFGMSLRDISIEALQNVNAPDWVVYARIEILNVFNRALNDELKAGLTSLSELDLGECPEFWINPLTNEHMSEGLALGCYFLTGEYTYYPSARKLSIASIGTAETDKATGTDNT